MFAKWFSLFNLDLGVQARTLILEKLIHLIIMELAHSPVLTASHLLLGWRDLSSLRFALSLGGTCSRGVFLVSDGLRTRVLGLDDLLSFLGLLSLQLLVLVCIDFSGALICVVTSGHLLSHHLLKRAILSSLAKLEDSLWLVGVALNFILSELIKVWF